MNQKCIKCNGTISECISCSCNNCDGHCMEGKSCRPETIIIKANRNSIRR
jgi:hypothetical protein